MAVSIADRNQRILIQQQTTEKDAIGNHTSAWTTKMELWANVTITASTEGTEAGITSMRQTLKAIVLQSKATAALCSNRYRMVFQGAVYNITGVMPYYTSGDFVQITGVSERGDVT